jgi:vacuolar protein sorting-associated protein VTA1
LAVAIKPQQTESRTFLLKLMDELETLKADLGDNEAVTDEIAGCAYVQNFCDGVFKTADDEDRAGRATR